MRPRFTADAPRPSAAPVRRHRAWARLAAVLALFVALQVGGLTRAVAEVVELVRTGEVHHREGCPDDEKGRDCPPDCPTCHCLHCLQGGLGLTPQNLLGLTEPLPVEYQIGVLAYDGSEPVRSEPSGIYRPPRSA